MQDFEIHQAALIDAWDLSGLVPTISEQPLLSFDCRGASDAAVPVYAEYTADEPWIAAESIGDMVVILIAAPESGAFTTNERGEWNELDRSRLPAAIAESGIV